MKYLSDLLPAESMVILFGNKAPLKELLKFTFMDLLLKNVLEITTISRQPSSMEEVRDYQYVVRGHTYTLYKPAAHELAFLSPFQSSGSIQILLHLLIRIGFQNSGSQSRYISKVTKSRNLRTVFTQNFLEKLFGGYTTTESGKKLRTSVQLEIKQMEKDLPPIINLDKEMATDIVNKIGGNIFLLKNIDYSLLKQIDSEILSQMHREATAANSQTGCFGCGSWDFAGDGAGAGCSGCSGCGGCGGD